MAKSSVIPPAGRALAALMAEGGPQAEKIRRLVHRSQLWRYARGERLPSVETASLLDEVSDGKVAANGWRVSRRRKAA